MEEQGSPLSPRLGLVAYATATGLGYQTRAIHDHLHPAKTLVIDLSRDKDLPLHMEWFPGARLAPAMPRLDDLEWLLDGIDVLFVCETPIAYEVFQLARERGIRTILQFNYEFLDYLSHDGPLLPKPTVFAAPSPWMIDRVDRRRCPTIWYLPVPVDPTGITQRTITEAKTFLHVAGRPAHRDRNGTLDYLQIARRCADLGARWILACQDPTKHIIRALRDTPVELVGDVPTPGDLYTDGDIMILPRKYGGLSMPALEAITAGMPVLMTDIPPNNAWLPPEWLSPVGWTERFRAKTLIDVYGVNLPHLEKMMRRLYAEPATVAAWATQARSLAEERTWDALLPLYRDTLTRVMELQP
jgi:glycosyltransferase involved in cell wall biosynthesis